MRIDNFFHHSILSLFSVFITSREFPCYLVSYFILEEFCDIALYFHALNIVKILFLNTLFTLNFWIIIIDTLFDSCTDWHVATNLEHHFVFPAEITLTTQSPDIVIWFAKLKKSFRHWVNGSFWRKFRLGTSAKVGKNMKICDNNVSEMAG